MLANVYARWVLDRARTLFGSKRLTNNAYSSGGRAKLTQVNDPGTHLGYGPITLFGRRSGSGGAGRFAARACWLDGDRSQRHRRDQAVCPSVYGQPLIRGTLAMISAPYGPSPQNRNPRIRRLAGLGCRAVDALRRWLHLVRERNRRFQELEVLNDREFERVLAETGLSRGELLTAIRNGPEVKELLGGMLARLGLLSDRIAPAVWPELERRCSLCTSRLRCRGWLKWGSNELAYRAFCPNAATIDSLLQYSEERR